MASASVTNSATDLGTSDRRPAPAIAAIFDGLSWLGLDGDEPPVFQFARSTRHAEVAHRLLAAGHAYRCYLTQEELAERRAAAQAERRPFRIESEWRDADPATWPADLPYVIRVKAPREGETVIHDLVQGPITVSNREIDDFLVVIRAMHTIEQAEGTGAWPDPAYAHIPLIHGADGAKLSKRHGALGVDAYRDELGLLPEAVVNYLLRLGWGHGDEEFIARDQAVEWFDIADVNKGAARFDLKKLLNLNGHYIRQADDARLAGEVAKRLNLAEPSDLALLTAAMPVLKVRAADLNELAEGARFLFAVRPITPDDKAAALLTDDARALLGAACGALTAAPDWTAEALEAAIKALAADLGLGLGKLAQPLRAALTGQTTSPGIYDVLVLLGRDEALARIGDQHTGAEDTDVSDTHASLNTGGKTVDLPVTGGTIGPDVIDIRKLYAQTGMFTYDPGFTSTASCDSAITYIDGDEGVLLHRGYPIGQLAEHSSFMEVSYLLLNGELPNAAELEDFRSTITRHTMVHEQLSTFYRGFRRDAHPMAVMCGVVGALSAFYHDSTDIADPVHRKISSHRLIAKIPTIAAMAYKYSVGQPFVYPSNKLSYTGNFLRMTFAVPAEDYEVNPVVERALDRIFILHADHEQNASTSTVRLAGSSGANPFACMAAGIACLWGPAHGGANEAALNMLKEIGTPDRIPHYIERAKDKNDPFRLMGFGHRVYKNYDPRATVMQQTVREVFASLKVTDPLFETALRLEEIALNDPYFIEKKLFPNVDFYSGIILSAIGFPTTMFTVLFALARTVGWVAQWNEMISDPGQKIGRPRQLYTGPTARDYVPLDQR
eukprot:gene8572-8664_t